MSDSPTPVDLDALIEYANSAPLANLADFIVKAGQVLAELRSSRATGPDMVAVPRAEYERLIMDSHRLVHQGAHGPFVWIVCNCGAEITRSGTTTWHSIFAEHLRDVRAALSETSPSHPTPD